MSSRRRIRRAIPPRDLMRFARAYVCLDCTGGGCEVIRHGGNAWTLVVLHDDDCPALAGTVSRTGTAREAARTVGLDRPVIYVQADLS